MIIKFIVTLSLTISVFYKIFNIYEDAACNDAAFFSVTKLSLRDTLTKSKPSRLKQINNFSDSTNLLCKFKIIKNKKKFSIYRLYKKKKSIKLNLKTSITNE